MNSEILIKEARNRLAQILRDEGRAPIEIHIVAVDEPKILCRFDVVRRVYDGTFDVEYKCSEKRWFPPMEDDQ